MIPIYIHKEIRYRIHYRFWERDRDRYMQIKLPEKWSEVSMSKMLKLCELHFAPKYPNREFMNITAVQILTGFKRADMEALTGDQLLYFMRQTEFAINLESFPLDYPFNTWHWIFKGPKARFAKTSINQYAIASTLYHIYLKQPNRKILEHLFATLYTPFGIPHGKLSDWICTWYAKRLSTKRLCKLALKMYVYKKQILKEFPVQHRASKKKGPQTDGWSTILNGVATEGPFGNLERVKKIKTPVFLTHLEDCAKKYRFYDKS